MARKKKNTINDANHVSMMMPTITSAQLEIEQPIVYQILKNSVERKRMNHAYMLVGNNGTQLLQIAVLIAQTLVCEKGSPLACSNCDNCYRVTKNGYSDGIVINNYPVAIKKEDILKMQSDLANTALEKAQVKYAIIHHIEHCSSEAANSLLKFIEEPDSKHLTMILTTTQEDAVLPTIRSRTQAIRCYPTTKPIDWEELSENSEMDDISVYAYEACAVSNSDVQKLILKESFGASINTFKAGLTMLEQNAPFVVYGQKQMFNLKDAAAREIVNDTFLIFTRYFKETAAGVCPIHSKMTTKQALDALVLTQECQKNLFYNANLNLCIDLWLIKLENIVKEGKI